MDYMQCSGSANKGGTFLNFAKSDMVEASCSVYCEPCYIIYVSRLRACSKILLGSILFSHDKFVPSLVLLDMTALDLWPAQRICEHLLTGLI